MREIAALATNPEVKRRLEVLAAEFETQHNNQNNHWSIVFGRLENSIQDELNAVRFDMTQAIGDVEVRQVKMLELLEHLQTDIRSLAARQVGGDGQPE